MEGSTILALAIGVLVALAALVVFTTARRRDTGSALSRETRTRDRGPSPFLADEDEATAAQPRTGREVERSAALARREPSQELERVGTAPPAPYVPPDEDTLGVTRRQFFNRSILAMFGLGLAGFGGSVLAFLWPGASSGFGSKISVGSLDDILAQIEDTREPFYVPEGRFYLNPYPPSAASDAAAAGYSPSLLPGLEGGVIALYQKCVHLGCRVPWCATSQWFECPCHGSKYNRVGEKKAGPAPRGLDGFPVEVSGGSVSVDTGLVIQGVPIGTDTTGQEAEGPACITGGE